MNISHLFFDLDNTLWDHHKNAKKTLEKLHKTYQIKEKHGVDFETFHEVYHEINEDLWAKLRDGEIKKEYLRMHRFPDTFLRFGIDDIKLALIFEEQFLDEIIEFNDLVPNAIEILTYLKQKDYKIHIITNGFHAVSIRKIEDSGIGNYIDTITSADETGYRKPNPKIFDYALHLANASKENSVLIGDDLIADVKGAQNYGLSVIFFDRFLTNYREEGLLSILDLIELKKFL